MNRDKAATTLIISNRNCINTVLYLRFFYFVIIILNSVYLQYWLLLSCVILHILNCILKWITTIIREKTHYFIIYPFHFDLLTFYIVILWIWELFIIIELYSTFIINDRGCRKHILIIWILILLSFLSLRKTFTFIDIR